MKKGRIKGGRRAAMLLLTLVNKSIAALLFMKEKKIESGCGGVN